MKSRDKKLWESVYAEKAPDRVSWYRPHLDRSLAPFDSRDHPPRMEGISTTREDDIH